MVPVVCPEGTPTITRELPSIAFYGVYIGSGGDNRDGPCPLRVAGRGLQHLDAEL
jgi:hypothetical protein